MKEKRKSEYAFFDSISVTGLSSLGYATPYDVAETIDVTSKNFTFLYADGGGLTVLLPKKTSHLSIGKGIFIPAETNYSITAIKPSTKLLFACFSAEENLTAIPVNTTIKLSAFSKALLSSVTSATEYVYGNGVINAKMDKYALIKALSEPLKLSENSDSERGQIIKNCLELLVLDNIKPAYKSINTHLDDEKYMFESEKITEKVTAELATNLNRVITLDEIAEKLFFSKSYIKSAFKKQTGMGIMQMHTSMRISEAKKLLAAGKSVSAVSEKLGFSSSNHFSAVFKAHTGISPTEYKKSLHF